MNLNQYTTKSQEAIQKAQQIAMEFGNQSIEPQHLLEGIFQVDENISAFLMKKSEADLSLIREKNRENLENLPKVQGGNIYLSQSANKVLLDAPNVAKKMGDEFVTIFLFMVKSLLKMLLETVRWLNFLNHINQQTIHSHDKMTLAKLLIPQT